MIFFLMFLLFQSGKTIKKWTSYFDYVGVDAMKPVFFGEGKRTKTLMK